MNKGKAAVRGLSATFRAAKARLDADGDVEVRHLLDAAGNASFIYDYIFGSGSLLATILRRTTERHSNALRRVVEDASTPPDVLGSVEALLTWESAKLGPDAARRERASACHTALWLVRGLVFMAVSVGE